MNWIVPGIMAVVLLPGYAARAQEPRTDGWVVLTLDEYRALRARAFPVPPPPGPPPIDAALTRVDYDLRVTGDTLSGEARLTVDVLKQGWVSVQAPSGVLVRGARLDGRPTTLVDGTPPRLLIARAGRAVLALDIVVPITSAGGTESTTLPAPGSAVSAVTLVVPRSGVDLDVTGGFVADRTEAQGDTRWVVYGTPGRPMRFSWKRRADDRRSTLPLRIRARVTQLVVLGEENSALNASVALEVVQGAAREVQVLVPDGVAVNQVSGATVADWRHERTTLTVTFLEPALADTTFTIAGDLKAPRQGDITIPLLRVPSAERETGGIAVDVAGSGEVEGAQPHGMDPADASALGDIVAGRESPSMAAFRYKPQAGRAPRDLNLTVSRYNPQAVLVANIEEARYEALAGEDGKLLVRARFAVRNNQRSFLAVTLPADAALWSAALAGRPVRPGTSATGALLLPLQKSRLGEEAPIFPLELVYFQRTPAWTDKGTVRLEMPSLDLPVSRTGLTVQHSPRFRVEPQPGAFRVDTDHGPWSAVLIADGPAVLPAASPAPPAPQQPLSNERDASADMKSLVDRLRSGMGRTSAGLVPVEVRVPDFGPSVFLAAELTPEGRPPSIEIAYRRVSRR